MSYWYRFWRRSEIFCGKLQAVQCAKVQRCKLPRATQTRMRFTTVSTLVFSANYGLHTCPRRCGTFRTRTSLFADASTGDRPQQQQLEPKSVQMHTSFRDIVDQYDAFILDQFGVLHNGVNPLDGAIELIKYMHEKKKKLIVLSNTSAPSKNALQRLAQLGFPQEYFLDAITSGEEASRYIRLKYGTAATATKKTTKVIFLTWDVRIPNNPRLTALPQAFLDACCVDGSENGIQVTEIIADADLVLLHGSEVWYRGKDVEPISLGSFIETGNCADVIDPLLRQFIQYNLPLICANPDEIVVTPTKGKAYMPGKIVRRYQDLGGTDCRLFGKPNVDHFEACIRQLQGTGDRTISKDRVAHVGDSLHHDILGANNARIPSIFITSGIHASQLPINHGASSMIDGDLPTDHQYRELYDLFESEGSIYPTHVVPAFRL